MKKKILAWGVFTRRGVLCLSCLEHTRLQAAYWAKASDLFSPFDAPHTVRRVTITVGGLGRGQNPPLAGRACRLPAE